MDKMNLSLGKHHTVFFGLEEKDGRFHSAAVPRIPDFMGEFQKLHGIGERQAASLIAFFFAHLLIPVVIAGQTVG